MILLGIVVTFTGFPELNIILLFIFLLTIGLLQRKNVLSFTQNIYFVLCSVVGITILRMVLMEVLFQLFMLSPLNLYRWTESVIHLISAIVILLSLIIWRKRIIKTSAYIVQHTLYYVIYCLLLISVFTLLVLNAPSIHILNQLHMNYWKVSYMISIVLFFVLLILLLISSHLATERLELVQQENLDRELLDYVEKLEVMYEELAAFRHDYINVLLSLDEAIRTKNIEMIEQVYKSTIAPTSQMMNDKQYELIKLSNITIPEVKSVLSVKVIEAQQQNINVTLDVPVKLTSIAMPLATFIRAISIILDNAIDEARESEKQNLQIACFEVDQTQNFIVRNSCKQTEIDIQRIFDRDYSHKGSKRGYGLFSLKKITEETPNAVLEKIGRAHV